MPILKFSGVSKWEVAKYAHKVDEIADLIGAQPENILFICEEDSYVYTKGEKKIIEVERAIYVAIEWMKREDKEQLLTDHIIKFFTNNDSFKNGDPKVITFFTDINGKGYINGKKVG